MTAEGSCTHLGRVLVTELPESVDGCEECLKTGENRSWCCADEIGMVIPKVHWHSRLPASPLGRV